jgi:hypothetical protein
MHTEIRNLTTVRHNDDDGNPMIICGDWRESVRAIFGKAICSVIEAGSKIAEQVFMEFHCEKNTPLTRAKMVVRLHENIEEYILANPAPPVPCFSQQCKTGQGHANQTYSEEEITALIQEGLARRDKIQPVIVPENVSWRVLPCQNDPDALEFEFGFQHAYTRFAISYCLQICERPA